jgi:hypothetical protein
MSFDWTQTVSTSVTFQGDDDRKVQVYRAEWSGWGTLPEPNGVPFAVTPFGPPYDAIPAWPQFGPMLLNCTENHANDVLVLDFDGPITTIGVPVTLQHGIDPSGVVYMATTIGPEGEVIGMPSGLGGGIPAYKIWLHMPEAIPGSTEPKPFQKVVIMACEVPAGRSIFEGPGAIGARNLLLIGDTIARLS